MTYDPTKHHRHSIRLRGYDYSETGIYYVTIVAQDRACLFGSVAGGAMRVNEAGRMIANVWDALPCRFAHVDLDAFVVMPNHVHGIVVVKRGSSGDFQRVTALSDIVRTFKSTATLEYTHGVKQSGWAGFGSRLWQRNYYEHVIRRGESLDRIRAYILENPSRWEHDRENPRAKNPEQHEPWQKIP